MNQPSSGKRRYTAEALDRLEVIQVAKKAGFTLSEIETLLSGFSETEPPSRPWKIMAQEKIEEVEALIERAQGMKRLLLEIANHWLGESGFSDGSNWLVTAAS